MGLPGRQGEPCPPQPGGHPRGPLADPPCALPAGPPRLLLRGPWKRRGRLRRAPLHSGPQARGRGSGHRSSAAQGSHALIEALAEAAHLALCDALWAQSGDDLLTMRVRTPFALPSLMTARSASSLRRRGSRKLEKQEPERSLGMASSRLPTGVSRLRAWQSLWCISLYAETKYQAAHETTWPIRDSFPQQVPGHDRAPGQSERGCTLV